MVETVSKRWIVDALDRYERPLVRYASGLLGNLDAARDVVQDCFLRLCQQNPERLDGHLKQWLFTVCRNRAIDRLRKERRMDTLEETEPSAATAPAERAEEREETGRVLACIDTLPPRQQEVLRLKFQEGLSYKQIAAVTDASVSHVGVMLHTAIRVLRRRLEKRTTS